ncbi:MAG: hypothetical protein Gaeavirus18_4 [Gaeavirus sp.]|uniref:Minor capsid protein P9 transmembrane helices domain-containing protein n=1 Tax=Gaeavirus sp. TaxID=2487767 RepID=A0A3G4ZZ81_9VIRU|nr:MAG: hypothetical protein Gaeavirus18_4 [Gaeavirus sp.]
METFWIYNPYIIVQNYSEILPTSSMSKTKQLNILSRLLIYVIILSLLFEDNYTILLICLTGLVFIIMFYFINKIDDKHIAKEHELEGMSDIEKYLKFGKKYNSLDNANIPRNNSVNKIYNKAHDPMIKNSKDPNPKNKLIESGYIDFDGKYEIGKDYPERDHVATSTPKIPYEQDVFYTDDNCRKPTADNPFANIVFTDYLDAGNLAEPCNVDARDTQINMQNLYNSTIYRNIEDVFERENSQRTFYTVPITTVPNRQTEFANWLYKTGPTCKEDSANCTYYEDPSMTSPRY